MVFMSLGDDPTQSEIVDCINGKTKIGLDNLKYDRLSGFIINGDYHLILIRGWGYLTGTGGLNLSDKEALEIQDSLAEYIIEKLNG